MKVTKEVGKFLKKYGASQKTLCLGISGGPDSIALFHILVKKIKETQHSLCLAHVHHGWRGESKEEMQQIQQLAAKWQLPCFTHSLDIDYSSPNLEDACRRGRLAFFHELYDKKKFNALVLAHHANDQAETILKRIFEGAFLSKISGLKQCSSYQEMPIWRPLMNCSKAEILLYLQETGIPYVEDPTNHNPRFLRARMRKELFPYVEGVFGKSIQKNLCRLANRISEMDDYLQRRIERFNARLERNTDGASIDFAPFVPLEKVEVEWFVKKLIEEAQDFLSFEQIQALTEFICSGTYDKKILSKKWVYSIHGGVLNLSKRNVETFSELNLHS